MNKLEIVKKVLKNPHFKWLNIFFRDICLIIVLMVVNYSTHFRSWWTAFLTGMLVVWISWQFTDYLNYKRMINGNSIR